MDSTKQKILKSAIKLFNDKGMVNVRLQHIADATGISVGNLAYHYCSKKAIVMAIDQQLENELKLILSFKQSFPHQIDFDNQLSACYFLLKKYAFFFLDLLEMERAYPVLHARRKLYICKMIAQIKTWMLVNVEKGILKPEMQENQYQHVAHTIWMIIIFWLTQQQVRGTAQDEGAFKEMVWNQLLPLFTASGLMEYEALILPQLKYFSNWCL